MPPSIPDIPDEPHIPIADMQLDAERGYLRRGNRSVRTGREVYRRMWLAFAKYPNRALSNEHLGQFLWHGDARGKDILRVHIMRARSDLKRLGSRARIVNYKGAYEFVDRPH